MSLIAELQRRSVFKVGIAYLVVAWLVIQAASISFPLFEAPTWALRVFVFVVALGFPLALVIAWAFELTPEGVKLEPAPVGNKRMYAIAGACAILAAVWFYRADVLTAQDAAPTVAQNPRLAVLPLSNFSPDPANAFFADGLHDDMLTALSRMQGVEVISRTTMQTFKDSKKKLSEIAQEVGATQVLEGSVRRDATRVRLTVQLIDARTDDHLWAETYDRPLSDALTLQNEVAQGVAKAMKVAIAQGADDAPPTAVPAAYDLFLKSRLASNREDRLKLLDSALLLDPKFTQARAQRVAAACLVLWFDETRSGTLIPQSRADIDQARAERPELPAIDVAEAYYRYYVDRDWTAALAMADSALRKDSNDGDAMGVRGYLLRRLGRRDEAIASGQRRWELDPSSRAAAGALIDFYLYYGRYRDALAVADTMLARLPPDSPDRDGYREGREWAQFLISGDRVRFLQAVEARRGTMPEAKFQQQRLGAGDPSAERLAALITRTDPWQKVDEGALYPSALDVAREADHLGDTAQRDRALDEAARLYATISPTVMARPYTIVHHARFLALRGDAKGTLADVERVLALSTPDKDATTTGPVGMQAVQALARAGETQRALDLLDASIWQPGVHPTTVYHSALGSKLLGAEPRYQALMKQIEARFEKP